MCLAAASKSFVSDDWKEDMELRISSDRPSTLNLKAE